MKKTQIQIIILIAIIAIGSVYLILSNSSKMYTLPQYEKMDSKEFTRITIEKGDNLTTLEKSEDDWLILPEKYKADPETVNTIINNISELTLTELISTSGQYSKYDLNDGSKTTVTAYNGNDIIRTFDFGKKSDSSQHTFIKRTDDPDIYQVRGNLDDTFNKDTESLRDKTALSFNAEDILLFTIKMDDSTEITLNKTIVPAEQTENPEGVEQEPQEKTVWNKEDGTEFKSNEIVNLIQTLSALKCNSYAEEGKEYGDILFAITLKGSSEYYLEVFNKTDDVYPASSSMNDYVFNLSSWQVENASKIFSEEE